MRLFLVSFLIVLVSNVALCFDPRRDIIVTLSVDLESRLTCFYQTLKTGFALSVYVDPSISIQLSVRLTSPSREYSEWTNADGPGGALHITHNVTEDGDWEVCIASPQQARVLFHLYAFSKEAHAEGIRNLVDLTDLEKNLTAVLENLNERLYNIFYSIKFYNQISVRDVAVQEKNSHFIKTYVVLFCISAVIASMVEVFLVRRMFRVDPSRIRI